VNANANVSANERSDSVQMPDTGAPTPGAPKRRRGGPTSTPRQGRSYVAAPSSASFVARR
jgi:hypothetical protein